MRKKMNIIMLSTKEASNLYEIADNLSSSILCNKHSHQTGRHLYITDDSEIKEGDWCINKNEHALYQITFINEYTGNYWSKIIATTNPELWENAKIICDKKVEHRVIAKIPQDFIEAYIKHYNAGTSIKEIFVDYVTHHSEKDQEGNYYEDNLKLRSDNSIIIHPVVEQKFTKEDMIQAFKAGRRTNPARVHANEWLSKNYPNN